MFNISNKFIFKAGNKTKSIVEFKEEIDNKIRETEKDSNGTDKVTITISEINTDYQVEVRMIEIKDDKDPNMKITTFIPNKKVQE